MDREREEGRGGGRVRGRERDTKRFVELCSVTEHNSSLTQSYILNNYYMHTYVCVKCEVAIYNSKVLEQFL